MAYMLVLVLMTLTLNTRSQWIGRGKQYLSYDIQTVNDGGLVHDINYAHVRLGDLDLILDFENVSIRIALLFLLCLCWLNKLRLEEAHSGGARLA